MNQKRSPADFIKQNLGREVVVRLNDQTELTGTLVCLDGALNMVLHNVKEYRQGAMQETFHKLVLRGNNIFYLHQKPLNYQKGQTNP